MHVTPGVYWQDKSTVLCTIGGFLIGIVCSSRMAVCGKVTGISGIFNTITRFELTASMRALNDIKEANLTMDFEKFTRVCYIGGMLSGGALLNAYFPSAIQDWSVIPLARLLIAGFLVGFGSTMGGGCTSGHGICGIAALRPRSFVATATFMIVGMVTSMCADTSSFLPFFTNELPYERCFITSAVCAIVSVVIYVLSHAYHTTDKKNVNDVYVRIFKCVSEILYGIIFSLALGIANMTRISATISFLDLRYWNPALAFVMMAALLVTFIAFNHTFHWGEPLLDTQFHRPTASDIDYKLVLGSSIFGIGWGLAGACLGPSITNVGAGNINAFYFVLFIVLGMWIHQGINHPTFLSLLERSHSKNSQSTSSDGDQSTFNK